MKLTWLGHACFLVEQAGYRIVIDPYEGVEGYPPLWAEAHEVLCSHHHHDHDAVERVRLLPRSGEQAESPFQVRTVGTFHDEEKGALRGENCVHILEADGFRVAHLGDLGHLLTEEQLAAIGPVDGILIPVGGVYTLDAAGAKAVCGQLRPRWIVPMHYHHPPFGLPEVAGVEDFLSLFPDCTRLEGPGFPVTPETAGVLVPRFG